MQRREIDALNEPRGRNNPRLQPDRLPSRLDRDPIYAKIKDERRTWSVEDVVMTAGPARPFRCPASDGTTQTLGAARTLISRPARGSLDVLTAKAGPGRPQYPADAGDLHAEIVAQVQIRDPTG
jgi:hypothetical protein